MPPVKASVNSIINKLDPDIVYCPKRKKYKAKQWIIDRYWAMSCFYNLNTRPASCQIRCYDPKVRKRNERKNDTDNAGHYRWRY